jgi:hypothetical protein
LFGKGRDASTTPLQVELPPMIRTFHTLTVEPTE